MTQTPAGTPDEPDGLPATVFSPDQLRSIRYWLWLAAWNYPTSEAPDDYCKIEPRIRELLGGDVWGEDDPDDTSESGQLVLRAGPVDATHWVEAHRMNLIALLASASDQSAAVAALVEMHGLSRDFAMLCLQVPIRLLAGPPTVDWPVQGFP